MAFLVTARAILMVLIVQAVPLITVGLVAGSIITAAALMLRLRGTKWGGWGRLALAANWLYAAVLTLSIVTDTPIAVQMAALVVAMLSVPLLAVALARAAADAREWKADRAWRLVSVVAPVCWLTLLAAQRLWPIGFGSLFSQAPLISALGAVVLVFTPCVAAYRAAGASVPRYGFSGHCLYCNYDMRGLKVRVCPECGRDPMRGGSAIADNPSALKFPLRAWLVHASLGVVAALVLGALLPNNTLERFKPLWLLMREMRLGPAAFNSHGVSAGRGGFPPMWEILRRADKGEFDQATASRLADHCLRVQADAAAPLYQWPDLFAVLEAQGLVSDAQRAAFADRLAIYTLKLPLSVPEGGHLPFSVEVVSRAPWSLKSSTPVRDWMVNGPRLAAVYIDGVQIPAPAREADAIVQGATSVHDFTAAGELPRLPLGPGKHRVRMEFGVKWWINDYANQTSTPSAIRTIALEGSVTLTPGAPSPVARIIDPAAIKPLLERWTWTYESYRLGGYKGRNGVAIQAPDGEPPLPFSVTAGVVIAYKGKEYPMGRLVLKAGELKAFVNDHMSWEPDFPGDVLPLIIRATNIDFESGVTSAWAGPEQRVDAKFRDPPPPKSPSD